MNQSTNSNDLHRNQSGGGSVGINQSTNSSDFEGVEIGNAFDRNKVEYIKLKEYQNLKF